MSAHNRKALGKGRPPSEGIVVVAGDTKVTRRAGVGRHYGNHHSYVLEKLVSKNKKIRTMLEKKNQ